MRHAGTAALAGVAGLLAQLRLRPGLVEKRPGVFYRKGQAFLHFHEDLSGMFVDIKSGREWLRLKLGGRGSVAGMSFQSRSGDRITAAHLESDDFR